MIETNSGHVGASPIRADGSPFWILARGHIQRYSDLTVIRTGRRLRSRAMDYQASRVAECAARLAQPGCVVLQDPTGTGKTIVALVTALVMLNAPRNQGGQRVDRVLVVAPSQTVAKLWQERALDAGFPAREVHFRPAGKLRWGVSSRGLFIVTKSSMPDALPLDGREKLLVIVDEAHRGLGSVDKPFHVRLAAAAADARALLVTATPFQLSASEFARVLEIASPKSETIDEKGRNRRSIEQYGEALVSILRAIHYLSKDPTDDRLKNAMTQAKRQECEIRPHKEAALADHMMSAFHRMSAGLPESPLPCPAALIVDPGPWASFYHVARILPELIPGAQASDAFLRMLCSSYEAFRTSDVFKKFEATTPNSPLLDAIKIRMLSEPHPKVNETATWAAKQLAENRHVLIFCVYIETQQALRSAIAEMTGNDGAAVAPVNAAQAQQIHRATFGREPGGEVKPLALVVRDNLSESIDLDGGKPCIVHHDLTWNPARFVQRMGRVTRASSNFWTPRESDVLVPVLDLELDRRLYYTMTYRAELSEHMLAALPPHLEVLDDNTNTILPYQEEPPS